MTSRSLSLKTLLSVLVFCAGILFALTYIAEPRASEAQVTTLSGYAWSDTIGWISLSGSNYGISVAADGTLSGYAWSDNIGWVSAQSSDVSGCPAGTCTPRISSGEFLGWLKAIAASGSGSGWDGWISLSCSNTGTCGTSNYGISNSGGVYSGYAWGSDVVGWIDFSQVLPPAAACTLSPSEQTVTRGTNASITWSSTDATSGSVSPGGNTLTPPSGGTFAVNPDENTTYTATFIGPGGQSSCQATVNVVCAPIYSCSGNTIVYTDAACATSTVTTCESPYYCTAGESTCSVPDMSFSSISGTSGHLTARPQTVRKGNTTRLYWNVENAESCTVSGNGNTWTGASSGASGRQSNPINQTVEYALSCTGLDGSTPPSITETVTVVPLPKFNEQ